MAGNKRVAALRGPSVLGPALLGILVGTAWQVQQASLWVSSIYAYFVLVALVLFAFIAIKIRAIRFRLALWFLACGLLALGVTGLRANIFQAGALDPGLEGRDIAVSGVVVSMPQRNETGVRFRFDLESAHWQGQPVRLPCANGRDAI